MAVASQEALQPGLGLGLDEGGGDTEIAELTSFANVDQYLALQRKFIRAATSATDPDHSQSEAQEALQQLEKDINVYQEQSYLLDPHLEALVSPPASVLRQLVRTSSADLDPTSPALAALCRLLYVFSKVRGYKIVSRFLPHEVGDLLPALVLLEKVQQSGVRVSWEVPYVLLLWLGIVCLVPFSLKSSTHDEQVASRIEHAARFYLPSSGKARDGAAVLLGRLYRREEVAGSAFPAYLSWARGRMRESGSQLERTGILQTLCEMVKNGETYFLQQHLDAVAGVLHDAVQYTHGSNTLVDRFRTKLSGRLALRLLPTPAPAVVDERVDAFVEELLQALQHQVVESVLDLLTVNVTSSTLPADVMEPSAQTDALDPAHLAALDALDLYAVSESTWHGAFLAVAEIARRTLLPSPLLRRTVYWVLRGLSLELRWGLSTVGASVRDAACYVMWALPRMREAARLRPLALYAAQRLVVVMTLDREVTVRRAASAAFQEWAGRTALFPHGIEVLGVADFAAVGRRRHAYLACAPRLACYPEYRGVLLTHALHACLPHWDTSVRALGAQAAAAIVRLDAVCVQPSCSEQLEAAASTDSARVHGALLFLGALAQHWLAEGANTAGTWPSRMLDAVAELNARLLDAPGGALILEAACRVIAAAFALAPDGARAPLWHIVHAAVERPERDVHNAVAAALHALRHSAEATTFVQDTLRDWGALPVDSQRCCALALGRIKGVESEARLRHLASLLCHGADAPTCDVETRQNAATSLALVAQEHLELVEQALPGLLAGAADYTVDQRGDVGSWVRSVSVVGLCDLLHALRAGKLGTAASDATQDPPLSPERFLSACVAIAAQTSEQINSLRSGACTQLVRLAHDYDGSYGGDAYTPPGRQLILDALGGLAPVELREAKTAYPRILRLLSVQQYRRPMLRGVALAIGGPTPEASAALVAAVRNGDKRFACAVLNDLANIAAAGVRDNRQFVPAMLTVHKLLDAGVIEFAAEEAEPIIGRVLRLATAHVAQVRSVQRVQTCMSITVALLNQPKYMPAAVRHLATFLTHTYPAVRMSTSKQLYLALGERDFENWAAAAEAEEVLLNTPWAEVPPAELGAAVTRISTLWTQP